MLKAEYKVYYESRKIINCICKNTAKHLKFGQQIFVEMLVCL